MEKALGGAFSGHCELSRSPVDISNLETAVTCTGAMFISSADGRSSAIYTHGGIRGAAVM